MCGRFVLITDGETVAEQFQLSLMPAHPLAPRYNIAPTQPVAAVRVNQKGERELTHFHWGLIPFWAKDTKMASRMINARSETVADKPAYRAAFKYRRCIVPATGFYEWQRLPEGGKQPTFIHHKDGALLAIAGIYEHWQSSDGGEIESVSLLTTTPNSFMEPIHNRMPVLLEPADYADWLDPTLQKPNPLRHLLRPYQDGWLTAYPVSTLVNNPRNEMPASIERVA